MIYFLLTILLFVTMLVYFKIAQAYDIIDKPNKRSAHTEVTLRGGGIIFPASFILFIIIDFANNNSSYTLSFIIFGIGLTLICIISFVDDIRNLSRIVRLAFHFLAVTFLLFFLNVYEVMPLWVTPFIYFFIIGVLNAYNFMDGINGMTGLYSVVLLGSLLYINQYISSFTVVDFIIYPLLACMVFLFFNFRERAKCFMGDVGSVGIGFWISALIGLLMIKTDDYKWILLLTVYGVDVVATVLERLKLKENIFDAHRRHLYQLFVNEHKASHRLVSTLFAMVQLIINILIISTNFPIWVYTLIVLVPMFCFYFLIKLRFIKFRKC